MKSSRSFIAISVVFTAAVAAAACSSSATPESPKGGTDGGGGGSNTACTTLSACCATLSAQGAAMSAVTECANAVVAGGSGCTSQLTEIMGLGYCSFTGAGGSGAGGTGAGGTGAGGAGDTADCSALSTCCAVLASQGIAQATVDECTNAATAGGSGCGALLTSIMAMGYCVTTGAGGSGAGGSGAGGSGAGGTGAGGKGAGGTGAGGTGGGGTGAGGTGGGGTGAGGTGAGGTGAGGTGGGGTGAGGTGAGGTGAGGTGAGGTGGGGTGAGGTGAGGTGSGGFSSTGGGGFYSSSGPATCANPSSSPPVGFSPPTGILGTGCTVSQDQQLAACYTATTDAGQNACDSVLTMGSVVDGGLGTCGSCYGGTYIVAGMNAPAEWGATLAIALEAEVGNVASAYLVGIGPELGVCVYATAGSSAAQKKCGLDVMAVDDCIYSSCIGVCAVTEPAPGAQFNAAQLSALETCFSTVQEGACASYITAERADCAAFTNTGGTGALDRCNQAIDQTEEVDSGVAPIPNAIEKLIQVACTGGDAGAL